MKTKSIPGKSAKLNGMAAFVAILAISSLACANDGGAKPNADRPEPDHVLYIQSNNAQFGRNAAIAYSRNANDGSLTALGSFPTGGTGFKNIDQRLGPDDTDAEIAV